MHEFEKTVILIPTKPEYDGFLFHLENLSGPSEEMSIGRCRTRFFRDLNFHVAPGGLGKVKFAVRTQYLLDHIEDVSLVICLGACGALNHDYGFGDVVIGLTTLEHDVKRHTKRKEPPYEADAAVVRAIRDALGNGSRSFPVHFGSIAGGDEDVMDSRRKEELRADTGCDAVAWEGAGGAYAARFSGKKFIEIRGVSDHADESASNDFHTNLDTVMGNLARCIYDVFSFHRGIS